MAGNVRAVCPFIAFRVAYLRALAAGQPHEGSHGQVAPQVQVAPQQQLLAVGGTFAHEQVALEQPVQGQFFDSDMAFSWWIAGPDRPDTHADGAALRFLQVRSISRFDRPLSLVLGGRVAQHAAVTQERADKLGILASALCALHCVAGAALVGALGVGSLFADERLELIFVAVAVLIAGWALTVGYRRHRRPAPLAVGIIGTLTLAGARFELGVESMEVVLSVLGAGVLISAHWMNLRLLRSHQTCSAPQSSLSTPSS